MVMIALCSSLIGAVLGTRLRVLVLFPVTLLGLALVTAVCAVNGSTITSGIGAAAVLAVCLQLGYLGGLLTRLSMTASRATPHRSLRSSLKVVE
jgi:hypothetical protein